MLPSLVAKNRNNKRLRTTIFFKTSHQLTIERVQRLARSERLQRVRLVVHLVVDGLVVGAALAGTRQRRVRRAEATLGTSGTAARRH